MTYNYFPELSNPFFLTVLIGTSLSLILESFVEWTNLDKNDIKGKLKELAKENPLASKLFSKAKIEKTARYSNDTELASDKFASIHGGFSSLFMMLGVLPFVFHTLLGFGLSIYWTYIVISLGQMVLNEAVGIPFSLYETFGIEQKYGFNRMTKKLFWTDMMKSFLLNLVLVVGSISIMNFLLLNIGHFTATKTMMLIGVVFSLELIMEAFGSVVMRMFNKFTPVKDKKLLRSLGTILKGSKDEYLLKRVFVMDGSKRSTHSNAFVMGFGKHKRIVLFDTLLKKYTPDEIIAILAHELSHSRKGHLVINRIIGFAQLSISMFILTSFLENVTMYHAFGFSFINEGNVSEYPLLGLALASMVLGAVKEILQIPALESLISRKMEYSADRGAVLLTGKKGPLSSSLLKLKAENLSDIFPSALYEAFNYDHPSVLNRLKNINSVKLVSKRKKTKKIKMDDAK